MRMRLGESRRLLSERKKVEGQGRVDAVGQQASAVIERAADHVRNGTAETAGRRKLRRRNLDGDGPKPDALERGGERSRREMIDVHEIVGEPWPIGSMHTCAHSLLQTLRRA